MKKNVSGMIILLLLGIQMFVLSIQPAKCLESPEMEWSRTFGGPNDDVPLSVIQTDDGGFALAGRTNSFGAGGYDFWFIKTNQSGHLQWNRTYGSTGNERAEGGAVQTSDGGYLLIGHKNVEPNRDMWVVKTDSNGIMMWNRTYGGVNDDTGRGAVLTDDGGYAFIGNTKSFGAGNYDFWLVKTNSTGHEQWSQTYGGVNVDLAASIIQPHDNGYALTGRTSSFGAGSHDFWLVKTNSTGEIEWTQTYGTTGFEAAYAVVQTYDGGYAVAGQKGISDSDFWLVKTNSTGHEQWNATYGGVDEDHAISMVQTVEGGYVLAGLSRSFGATDRDFWVVKTDSTGNLQWNQAYGESNDDLATSVIQTDDGGYAVTGAKESTGAGDRDFWLIKLAAEVISVTIDIDPDALNLRSNGEWITVYIELPEDYDVNNIDVSTIMLNNTISVDLDAPLAIGDYDEDGTLDLMVKFDRSEVIDFIISVLGTPDKFTSVTLTVTGELDDGTVFEGNDTIKVIYTRASGAGRRTFIR